MFFKDECTAQVVRANDSWVQERFRGTRLQGTAQQEKQYKEQMAQQKEQMAQQKEQIAQQEEQYKEQIKMLKQLLDRR